MKYINFLFLLFISYGVTAQEKLLTKEDAVNLALEYNFGIKVAKNQVEIAENNQSILNSGYLPTLTGTAGANYNRDDSTIQFPGRFVTDDDGVIVIDPVTQQPTPFPDTNIDKAEAQTYNATLRADYTLFDGLGRFYNYKILKEQYKLSELQARETIENTIIQLFSVYYEIARLIENKNVLQQALDISKDRIKRSEYAFEYGQSTKLDVLNAQVDVTNDSINLLNASLNLTNTKRDMNVLLNKNINENYKVDTIIRFLPKLKLEEYITKAELNNISLLQAERNININAYDIKVSKSGYLPSIGLNGSYGWNLNQSAPSAFFPGNDTDRLSFGLGASLTWNLFDGGATSTRIKNAKIVLDNQEILKEQISLQVKRDIKNAEDTYQNSLSIFQIQQQNVATNQNNFERSKEQFQLGRISSLEFRQAQINLLNAQTNKNLAKYNAKLAELQLIQLTGQLLNIEF